ncbi:MAG: MarR family transcriptional regulator [Sulfolobaceae archaeon]
MSNDNKITTYSNNSYSLILELIRKYGELKQSDLVNLSGISKSRVSEILTELEKKGIIERKKLAGRNLIVRLSSRKFLTLGIIKAAEYPFIVPFIKLLKDRGYNVDVKVYNNGLEVTKDLSTGKLDMALSPVVTQLLFQKIFNNFKIIAGGAKGGGAILGEPSCNYIATTSLSSMEFWSLLYDPEASFVEFSSPEDMINAMRKKEVKKLSIWEPYVTILSNEGFRIIHTFEPLHCCTFAIRNGLDSEYFKEIYEQAFTSFLSNKDRWIQDYSSIVNIDYQVLKKSAENYVFDSYLDLNEIRRNMRKSGILLP